MLIATRGSKESEFRKERHAAPTGLGSGSAFEDYEYFVPTGLRTRRRVRHDICEAGIAQRSGNGSGTGATGTRELQGIEKQFHETL